MKRPVLLLALFALLLSLPGLSSRQFSTRGEPREALVSQAMLNTGNWVLPHAYSGDVPSKPPFLHWFVSLGSLVQGQVTEFSARLPSVLASLLLCIALFKLVARLHGSKMAWCVCGMLLTCIEWYRNASICRVDMIFACTLAGSFIALFRWLESEASRYPKLLVLLITAAALSKGPAAIALTGAVFGAYALFRGRGLAWIILWGIKIMLPVVVFSSLWYGLAYLQDPQKFAEKVYYENVARFLGTQDDEPHKHGLGYLVGTLLLGFMPWVLLLIEPAAGLRRSSFNWLRSKKMVLEKISQLPRLIVFSSIVCLIVLIFFAIPSSKRSAYLLPMYPFLSVLVGHVILVGERSQSERAAKASSVAVGVIILIFYVGVGWLSLYPGGVGELLQKYNSSAEAFYYCKQLTVGVLSPGPFSALFLALPAVSFLYVIVKKKPSHLLNLGIVFSGALIAASGAVLPATTNGLGYKEFSAQVSSFVNAKGQAASQLYSFGSEFYGVSFYMNKTIYRLDSNLPAGALVLVEKRDREGLEKALQGRGLSTVLTSSYAVSRPDGYVELVEVE